MPAICGSYEFRASECWFTSPNYVVSRDAETYLSLVIIPNKTVAHELSRENDRGRIVVILSLAIIFFYYCSS